MLLSFKISPLIYVSFIQAQILETEEGKHMFLWPISKGDVFITH